MESTKKICISTTTHLCANPRLVKELKALATETKHKVLVVFFQYDTAKIQYDEEIIRDLLNIAFIQVKWNRKWLFERFAYTLFTKFLILIFRYTRISIMPEQQVWAGYLKLKSILRKHHADIYHGHNPGTLAAVTLAAEHNNALSIFDAEDFHRGEGDKEELKNKIWIKIENKYIPKLTTLISASPLITKEYEKLYPAITHLTVNNYFPKNNFVTTVKYNEAPLKLVWFSQVVGLDRGLQSIIEAIDKITDKKLIFHIIGNCDEFTKNTLKNFHQNKLHEIEFKPPVSNIELEKLLTDYDIGFASEPGKDLNNELALSNKLFSYIQAGLLILASDTQGQADFMLQHPEVGYLYKRNNTEETFKLLSKINKNREMLLEYRTNATYLSEIISWDNEKSKFLNLISNLL